jgi:hypothetical protein
VADILLFLKERPFDAEVVGIITHAFDAALRELPDTGQPALMMEVVANRIIDLASIGERDPQQIARRALQELGVQLRE